MKKTMNRDDFIQEFMDFRPDDFSHEALDAIFEYIEDQERDLGEEFEFDPIAICCSLSEYDSATEAAENYGYEPEGDDDEKEQDALEWLQYRTTVIEVNGGGVVVAQF